MQPDQMFKLDSGAVNGGPVLKTKNDSRFTAEFDQEKKTRICRKFTIKGKVHQLDIFDEKQISI